MNLIAILITAVSAATCGYVLSNLRSKQKDLFSDEVEMLKRRNKEFERSVEEKKAEVETLKKKVRRMRMESELSTDESEEAESKLSDLRKVNARLNAELSDARRQLAQVTRLYEEKVSRLHELGED